MQHWENAGLKIADVRENAEQQTQSILNNTQEKELALKDVEIAVNNLRDNLDNPTAIANFENASATLLSKLKDQQLPVKQSFFKKLTTLFSKHAPEEVTPSKYKFTIMNRADYLVEIKPFQECFDLQDFAQKHEPKKTRYSTDTSVGENIFVTAHDETELVGFATCTAEGTLIRIKALYTLPKFHINQIEVMREIIQEIERHAGGRATLRTDHFNTNYETRGAEILTEIGFKFHPNFNGTGREPIYHLDKKKQRDDLIAQACTSFRIPVRDIEAKSI